MTPRDVFLTDLLELAKKDKDVVIISPDMGAPTLDLWKEQLPEQTLTVGIAEQNAINLAAGLAFRGKKVFVYMMACWAARCFEQIRYSCAMANNPITILATSVGLGYAPAGPAHEPNDDIAYMRSLCGIEVHTPTNNLMVKHYVNLCYHDPKLRYIRLERNYDKTLDGLYELYKNYTDINSGLGWAKFTTSKTCIVSCGYLLSRALKVGELTECSVIDLWRVKPIDGELLSQLVAKYNTIITLEEQSLSGGFGSAVCEVACDLGWNKKIVRLGLPDRYIFENGTRDQLLDSVGLSVNDIRKVVNLS